MTKKLYYAAFIPEAEGGYHIAFPDIPRCFTEGDTLAEGYDRAVDVLEMVLRDRLEHKETLPEPSALDEVKRKTAAYLKDIDHQAAGDIEYYPFPAPELNAKTTTVTISMPMYALEEIDRKAQKGGYTRSGFLVKAAHAYGE
jgi:predicted RNase H-like HicB family nuclease